MDYEKNRKIYERDLAELKKLRETCLAENRKPTADEEKRAKILLAEVEYLESTDGEVERTPVGGNSRDANRVSRGYEIRTHVDKKDYRSLYGSDRGYSWEDRESGFFEALFSGRHHPGLTTRSMTEGTPSDGGFLVPTEFAERIHNVSLESELVMPKATVIPMRSQELKLPGMSIGSHASSLYGGFTASYKAEAAALTEANPKIRQMSLMAKKLTGFLRFSNELMMDAQNGENQILDICGKGLSWYRDKAFLKGSGVGEPLGILNADCTLAQAKEAGQSADTIVYENLVGMLGKLHPASFKNSIWVCHQSTIPELLRLNIAIGVAGAFVPVLNESNGQFSILTRPCVFTEKTETLGNQGDILLADFSQYLIGLRGEMRIDLSQHLYFNTDEGAARLIERHDGMPLWSESLTLQDGSTEVSPFVTLAERA